MLGCTKSTYTKISVFMIIKIYMMEIVECQRIKFKVDNQRYHHIIKFQIGEALE